MDNDTNDKLAFGSIILIGVFIICSNAFSGFDKVNVVDILKSDLNHLVKNVKKNLDEVKDLK
ncbi:MAG: hypothetical protein HRT87_05350 [Legionellales bacterium]|nr:hypothetical protein [Legionellales bacterium]